ncbi:hypothetical protein [Natronoglycomyces albus]|uniref:Uncharacterized protein n=1 Tax=Natronoglycomyces albus TaxID=2811108 RepID=A0A895XKM2_9ACTN|nr:hypothetical protein [Natronoglycomyces albus]QSB05884.1 hypothetical protein JQS30_02865 [Natronoglycomyces albus]
MRPSRRFTLILASTAATVVVASACTASEPEKGNGDQEQAMTAAISQWHEVDDQFQHVLAGLERIYRACLEADGFTVHAEDLLINRSDRQEPWETVLSSATITAPETDQARENGYGASPNDVEPSGPNDFTQLPAEERSAYWIALRGYDPNDADVSSDRLPDHEVVQMPDGTRLQYPTVGCQAEGDQIVFGSDLEDFIEAKFIVRDRLFGIVFEEVHADEGYLSAVDEWSECMSERGWDLEAPIDARNTASDIWYHTEELTDADFAARKADEIELATHHAECADETRLREIHETALWESVDTYLVANESTMRQWAALISAASERIDAHEDDQ